MKANQAMFLPLLEGKKQFIIPIYQRTYAWTTKQCSRLWHDIVRVATDNPTGGHFIGSIVYIEGDGTAAGIGEWSVIDGQQRLTTLAMILAALARYVEGRDSGADISAEEIRESYLINRHAKGGRRYKLLLTQSDREPLFSILEGDELPADRSSRIVDNYRFFEEQIHESDMSPDLLYNGIGKLGIVEIKLSRQLDNPQLIFESLNSTGLDLSQADLIRNYVLMGLQPGDQERIYNKYWHRIEKNFAHAELDTVFDRFMRDYLTLKSPSGAIPNIREVYESFKTQMGGDMGTRVLSVDEVEPAVADIYRYSKHFAKLAFQTEEDTGIAAAIADINALKVDVAYPFLLRLYDDYEQRRLSRQDFISVLRLVESYVFRRAVCGVPTNVLNKTFATIGREVDTARYLESIGAMFLSREGKARFPTDEEFRAEFKVKDIYNFRSRNYLLSKLENFGRKELVRIESYTIEHVMPQNENLPVAWRRELGGDWEAIHRQYLHTIGNLTLTGYNSELGDRPFIEKRDIEGGFRDSPLRLNRMLADLEHWNAAEIEKRAEVLAEQATNIWTCPQLPAEVLERYRRPKVGRGEVSYTLDDHRDLQGRTLELFEQLRKRILNLDSSVREEVKKLYIAYKTDTNFVDIVPQRSGLRLSLNMRFDQIVDPKGLAKDVTNVGRWGNGDVELRLSSEEDLDDVMALIRQSYELHEEVGVEKVESVW